MRLYKAIILSTLLHSADVWPLAATLTKRLNAVHHRWQRSILGISWKDRVINEEVRVRTGQHSMGDILSERRLHWFGHVILMDHHSAYLDRRCTGRFRGLREVQPTGCPRTNWRSTVNNVLLRMGIIWQEVEVAAQNRSEWLRSVAQCIHLDEGRIKINDN